MDSAQFFERLESAIAKYDLLCHPFYQAWTEGKLTHDDLREYACNYYHHVQAFPRYLAEFALRLDEGELRRAVLANMCDEKGTAAGSGKNSIPHSELWLDFAEGMGASRDMRWHLPIAEVAELVRYFHNASSEATPAEALAAFYAYESQVPCIAKEKERGLREMYGADDKTCGYFSLHATADVYHSDVWRTQLEKRVTENPEAAEAALASAEKTAQMLWKALDGIEAARTAYAA
ncbi:MAG TPA: iron-containing redox enzyme family protein [Candidatus Sulfotelmatobacter sp.]|jgi:pyrroloquinoline-quinone synthase